MNITILGTGYVGLVTGACLADLGNNIVCIDSNLKKINHLKNLKIPFYEPGLEEIILRNVKSSRLSFSSSYKKISSSELIFLCIDTPRGPNGKPNLSNLYSAIDDIGSNLTSSAIVVLKSTVPLGTNKKVLQRLEKILRNDEKNFTVEVCANPEFLKEGSAVTDFLRPERIVIGADSNDVFQIMRSLYKPLNRKSNKIIEMSVESAELTKYASNAFLATKISFINQIARIAEISEANIHDIRRGIGSDSRIGKDFLYAGLGYGGSCFPKDIKALIETGKSFGLDSSLLQAVERINSSMTRHLEKKVKNFYKSSLKNKTIMVWGLSFKPNTDDTRDSVAIKFINNISTKVKCLYVFDPVVEKIPDSIQNKKNIFCLKHKYQKISQCDALIICTEWKEFWNPDIDFIAKLNDKVIFDGRNILDYELMESYGIKYFGIGVGRS